jgi:hypothetical protein
MVAPISTPPSPVPTLGDDLDWPQAKSKKPIVFAALGALVLIVAIWAIASSSGEPDPAPTVTPHAATPGVKDPMDAPPNNPMDSRGEPPPAKTPPPEPAGDSPSGGDAPSSAPASGDFEDIFKKSVKKER